MNELQIGSTRKSLSTGRYLDRPARAGLSRSSESLFSEELEHHDAGYICLGCKNLLTQRRLGAHFSHWASTEESHPIKIHRVESDGHCGSVKSAAKLRNIQHGSLPTGLLRAEPLVPPGMAKMSP